MGGNTEPKIALNESFIKKHYNNFIEKNGYVPEMFNPYHEKEILNIAPTQTGECGSTTSSSTILIKNATKKGYEEAVDGDSVNLAYPNSKTRRGRVGHQISQTLQCNDSMGVVEKLPGAYGRNFGSKGKIQNTEDICDTLQATMGNGGDNVPIIKNNISQNFRIRKLTSKECWRLMNFDDESFEKAKAVGMSNTQLYKQARKFNCGKSSRKNI